MTRVFVICEGQTEEAFVKNVLNPDFSPEGIFLFPRLIGRPGHKGGNFKFSRLLTDLKTLLLSDRSVYCTTFFDYYGLPTSFPGKESAQQSSTPEQKSAKILTALRDRVEDELGPDVLHRFIPYIQMHEFEGLLFSDPTAFARGLNRSNLTPDFQSIRDQFDSPEEINDSQTTAPSKRIMGVFDGYEKPLHGSMAALEIGVDVIRRECPLFSQWLTELEKLG